MAKRRGSMALWFVLLVAGGASRAAGQCEGAMLTASDAGPAHQFANAVALEGDYLLIGCHFDDEIGPLAGAAYMFERSGGQWLQKVKLKSNDLVFNDRFGFAVDLSGTRAVVGTRYRADYGYGSGAAYVFERVAGQWTQVAKLLPSDPAAHDFFGHDAAISSDTIVVGAPRKPKDGAANAGAAYVFQLQGAGWVQTQKLLPAGLTVDDRFGEAVAIDGDVILVGCVGDDDKGESSGSVYVYERQGGAFVERQKLLGSDSKTDDQFGMSLDVYGSQAMVCSLFADSTVPDSGAVYVWRREASGWTETQILRDPAGGPTDYMGAGLALTADSALLGSWGSDLGGINAGKVLYYHVVDGAWQHSATFSPGAHAAKDNFGWAVALDGSNGVVGARGQSDFAGAAWVFSMIGQIYAYGETCTTGTGAAPTLSATGCPTAGGFLDFHLGAAGTAPIALLMAAAQEGNIPLPGPCQFLLSPPVVSAALPLTPNPKGNFIDLSVPVPPIPGGGIAYLQAFVSEPSAALGAVNSNAVRVAIQ